MQTAIKIDFNGGQVEMRAFDASRLRTTGMTFRCMYCDRRVILYRRSDGPAFVHNVRNPACSYPRKKRIAETSTRPRRVRTIGKRATRFWVEIVAQGTVESASTVYTSTPIKAAEVAAKGPVTFRRNEDRFIKVTLTGAQQSFQFVRA